MDNDTMTKTVTSVALQAMVTHRMTHAEATALHLAAGLLYAVPSAGGLPSKMESARRTRTVRLPDGMLQEFYERVGTLLGDHGTGIQVCLIAVDNYRYGKEDMRGVFAYTCTDKELEQCHDLTCGDGNLGLKILKRYTPAPPAAEVAA
ncbi:MAG: hypothetical protein EON60_13805 [Alphaproteobacteria bacterium]|nr:MAG: hypothetical protein EON60_13805 [Alphaproteobacteria bacterium]